MVHLRFLNEKPDPLNEKACKLIWRLQCKHPWCLRVLLLACTTRTHTTSLSLTYEKTLGSRSLRSLNMICHYSPPLKSPASIQTATDDPESTVESESTNDSYRINRHAPMPPGLTLSVFLSPIRQLESTVPCPNRKQRSMRSSPSVVVRSAPVLIQHATKTFWCTARRGAPQGPIKAIPQSLTPHERQLVSLALWATLLLKYMDDQVLHAPHRSSAMRFVTADRGIGSLLVKRRTLRARPGLLCLGDRAGNTVPDVPHSMSLLACFNSLT